MLERKFCIYQPLDQGLVVCHKTNTEILWTCRIRYPDPAIKVNDTVKINLATGKIDDFIRFDTGVIAMATGGRNMGRVGVITHRERHDGGFNIVHIKDAIDNEFATRESNVFVIGREKPWISLPKGKGVKVGPISLPRVLSALLTFRSSLLLRRETAAGLMLWLVSKCGEQTDSSGSMLALLYGECGKHGMAHISRLHSRDRTEKCSAGLLYCSELKAQKDSLHANSCVQNLMMII